MDFFDAQEAARRRTGLLVALFGAAVIAIVAVVYGVAHIAVGPGPEGGIDFFLLLQVALGVAVVITAGCAIRISSLRSGGPAVAELVGGRRVLPDTSDPDERKLVNVVEEMSIASGTPVPAIYVLENEPGINAFAAGYTIHDAAVAVTRGALRELTRDELQGVIAHEFSHILNGDMRLNVRLIGVLYGILLLAVIGRGLFYAGRGGSRERDGGTAAIFMIGMALLLVGYIGVFFGKLIKAAVSRQREYLADSAAVQFTRNPEGLAGALKKIGAQAEGSRVQDHHAEELSHLFFANGLSRGLGGGLSTHPPLEERIRRIEPAWDGSFEVRPVPRPRAEPRRAAPSRREGAFDPTRLVSAVAAVGAAGAMASVGTPTPEHLKYAAALLERFPEPLLRAVHDRDDAQAVIFALVAGGDGAAEKEREEVAGYGGEEMVRRFEALVPLVHAQGPDAPLPLLDLALPALQQLTAVDADRFRAAVERVARANGGVRLFEFALAHTLARRLQGTASTRRSGGSGHAPGGEVEVLLSAVAWAGSGGREAAAEAAFAAGSAKFQGLRFHPRDDLTLSRIDTALSTLEGASPSARRQVLEGCAAAAEHDGVLERSEAELLRAIAEGLDAPIPPLLGVAAPAESGR